MKSKIYLVNTGIDTIGANSRTFFLPFSDESDYSTWDASRATPIANLLTVDATADYLETAVDGGIVFDPTKQYLYDLSSTADDKNSEYLGLLDVDSIPFTDLNNPSTYSYNSDSTNPNLFDSIESAFTFKTVTNAIMTFRNTFNNANLYHSLSYNGIAIFIQETPGTTDPIPLLIVRFEKDQLVGAPLKIDGSNFDVRNKAFSRTYSPKLNVELVLASNSTLGSSSENFLKDNEFLITNKSLYLPSR